MISQASYQIFINKGKINRPSSLLNLFAMFLLSIFLASLLFHWPSFLLVMFMYVLPVNWAQYHIVRPTHRGGIGLFQTEVNIYTA